MTTPKPTAAKVAPAAKAPNPDPNPPRALKIRSDLVDGKPSHVLLEPWPEYGLFSRDVLTSPLAAVIFKQTGDDVLEVHVANGDAIYELSPPTTDGVRQGKLVEGADFQEPWPAPAEKPAEDPDLVALRSALTAPGHAVGDTIKLPGHLNPRHGHGLFGIGVDTLGRVWRLEETAAGEQLVLAGRLAT